MILAYANHQNLYLRMPERQTMKLFTINQYNTSGWTRVRATSAKEAIRKLFGVSAFWFRDDKAYQVYTAKKCQFRIVEIETIDLKEFESKMDTICHNVETHRYTASEAADLIVLLAERLDS